MRRRILSIVMSVIVLVNTYAMSISAETVEAVSGALSNYADGFESGFSLGNIETSSDTVLGGILAETIDEEIAVASEKAAEANRIIDVKVVDTYTMSVEFTADIDCTAIVAIYDETGVQMLTSGSIEVFADETQTYIDFDDIPDYFFLRAYLVETETMKPLSTQYESDLYTQDMQEFVNKTVDDFEQDKILNFDDDNTTNFAVYNDSTIIVEETQGVNTIVLQDDENGVYEFADADESIINLASGDVLSYEYLDNEVVLIKVDTINVDGNNVRITGTDIEKEDVFEYISVDTISDAEDAKVDTSYMDEDIEYLGLAEGLEENEQQTYASISGKKTLGFEFELGNKDKGGFDASIKGKLNFAATIKLEFKWSRNKKYFDAELEYVVGFKDVTINAGYNNQIKMFPEFSTSPVAGVYITFKPSLVIDADVSVKVNANLSGSIGFRIKGNGIENISKNPKFKTELKLEGKVYIGISMEPKVKILSDYIANASMKAEAGVELSMKSCDKSKNDMTVSIHDCKGCFEGEIDSKFNLSVSAKIAKVKFEIKAIKYKCKITDMYYSSDFNEFGFDTCPHIKYKVSVEVKDASTKKPIEGVLVYDDDCITNEKGKVSFFVPNGEYKNKIVPVKEGYKDCTAKNSIRVKNNSKSLSLFMIKTSDAGEGETGGETENPEETEIYWPDKNKNFIVEPRKDGDLWWSIDEDGLLEIWGKGDYANADWTWLFYTDRIKTAKIVVSDISNCRDMFRHCHSLTTIDVSKFDTSNVTDMGSMFSSCRSLTTIDVSKFDTSKVTNMNGMFEDCDSLTTIDVSKFDTSKVTNMNSMFEDCDSLTTIDVSNFDTSNVTDMGDMFSFCRSLTTIDVSKFDTSKVTNMGSMFRYCESLTTIGVRNFNTSKVADMSNMFDACHSLTTIDVSKFDTSKVTDMGEMFYGCKNLITIDVSKFDTSRVTNMGGMFRDCHNLTTIDNISKFDTSKVTNMGGMFWDCHSLTTIDVSNFDTSKVTDMSGMFYRCENLITIDVSNFDTSKVTNMSGMFEHCHSLTTIDVNKFDTRNVTSMSCMFYGCGNLITIDVSNFDTSNVTSMGEMFYGCKNLITIDVSNFGTSKVTNMGGMFWDCHSLTTIDVRNFDTSNVTDMESMFMGCHSLMTIDVSSFDTSKVTNMRGMFWDCLSLTTIDVNNFDTSKVTDMRAMFCNCKSLITIDVRNFDTNNVTNMEQMFSFCHSLTTIDVSNFDTSKVTNMMHMFDDCNSLTTIDLSNFDTGNVTRMEGMFYGCMKLETVYLNINPNAATDGMFEGCPATVITPTTSSSLNKDDTYAIEKSVKPYTMLTTSYDEAQAESDEVIEVQNTGNMTAKTFTGLKPNTVYNFYDMKDKDAAEPYATDNILFIIQATSDASGTIEINYIQREPYESSDAFVVPMQGYILFGQVESFSASSDTSHAVDIKLYNSNDTSMNNAIYEVESTDGTYEIDDVEAGDYIMSVSKENHVTRCYNITISDSDTEQDVTICLKGDVTGDGKVNSQDLNTVRNHINYAAQITDEYKFRCADVTGDGRINSQDLNAIRNHINYENRFW
ncbi:MAG: BspA family leucine-rich repeat surface protein [Clostridium sp.]|nr:BspA family leucine-rich repeat surface protein [Clostridium sp.]